MLLTEAAVYNPPFSGLYPSGGSGAGNEAPADRLLTQNGHEGVQGACPLGFLKSAPQAPRQNSRTALGAHKAHIRQAVQPSIGAGSKVTTDGV